MASARARSSVVALNRPVQRAAVVQSAARQSEASSAEFAALGRSSADDLNSRRAGLPIEVVDFVGQTLGIDGLATRQTLGISERTFARRKVDGVLTAEESDRVLRLLRLRHRADEVIGAAAQSWLSAHNRALDGRSPHELAASETGAAVVHDVLTRIEHGVFS